MNELQKSLLKDLQTDLDNIKKSNDYFEVVVKLQELKNQIDLTIKLLKKENY